MNMTINKYCTLYRRMLYLRYPVFKQNRILHRGACYKFACLLQRQFPEVVLAIGRNGEHCAATYKEQLYDIDGKIKEEHDTFYEATDGDISYMEREFLNTDLDPYLQDLYMKEIETILLDPVKVLEEDLHMYSSVKQYMDMFHIYLKWIDIYEKEMNVQKPKQKHI